MTAMQDRSFADMIDTSAKLGSGHVTVQDVEYRDLPSLKRSVTGGDAIMNAALAHPQVIGAVPRISASAMLATASESFGSVMVAYDPDKETEATLAYIEGLDEGALFEGPMDKGIVLGATLAQNLGAGLGDKIVYTMMGKDGDIKAGLARLKGTLKTGTPSVDASIALMPIGTLRETIGYAADESTQIAIFIDDPRKSEAVAEALAPGTPEGLVSLPWSEVQPDLAGFIAMKVGGSRFMELVIMLLVAAGIFNTLFVSVMERMREFGIMTALGFTPGQVFSLVMLESLWLGLVGLASGAVITYPLYAYLAKTGIDLTAAMGGKATEVAGVGFDPLLKVGIFPENLVLIGAFVLGATLLSGVYPAWRAGQVEPVKAIKMV